MKLKQQAEELERQTQEMLRLEQEIAYDIAGDTVERTQEEILNQKEHMIEKSDLTEIGVAVPEMLVTEEDEGGTIMHPDQSRVNQGQSDEEDRFDMTHKTDELDEFMKLESQVKQATMGSRDGDVAAQVFVGDSFRDEMADSIGT